MNEIDYFNTYRMTNPAQFIERLDLTNLDNIYLSPTVIWPAFLLLVCFVGVISVAILFHWFMYSRSKFWPLVFSGVYLFGVLTSLGFLLSVLNRFFI
ncbi:hypothetical protein KC842_01985 [Candidatus Nomurabacteria bacterium]|nr:hypothetical protein [Candidatus Nomurabacteria bacterium]USN94734.1 MAG: hypothetical protein H6791_03200 [Candidatus Nomurabacteria bacterium]